MSRNKNRRKWAKNHFLIICEGKTEEKYFKSFKLNGMEVEVKIEGIGANTESLVKKTIAIRNQNPNKYNQVWCVFDRDDFPAKNFNQAFILARKEGIQVAYSNQAFELWFLLHFGYFDSAMHRNTLDQKISERIGENYERNTSYSVFENKKKLKLAIENAEKLLANFRTFNPEKNNPSTTVHNLVKELNKFLS
ncbi:MAG: RloB domain-containing protein [Calditrichaeota bacterium]|nr:MAG: RloB domain-containing protein [Calditrichota bacterium]